MLKLSKCTEFFSMSQEFHIKLHHSQLPLQKKKRLEENAFKFQRKVFIDYRNNQAPYQDSSIPIYTLLASFTRIIKTALFQYTLFLQATLGENQEYLCPQPSSTSCFIPGRSGIQLPHDLGAGLGHQQHRKFLA